MTTPLYMISANDIKNEFGATDAQGRVSLGAYRVSQNIGGLSNLPLDSGIPQSGMIKYQDMRNKRLNIVVNYYSSNETRPQTARERYDANNVTVVGGFTSRPSNPAGHKVKIHVNKTISGGTGANQCALRTGSFGNTATSIDVGSNGRIYGAGGAGGAGGDNSGAGAAGGDGTHAVGVEQNTCEINILSGGIISSGYGGGGGGGAGSPVGAAGDGGEGGANGGEGNPGTTSAGGDGGAGGSNDNQARAGEGGEGGDVNGSPTAGEGGDHSGGGGAAGSNGQAFRATMNINQFHPNLIHNSGTVRGGTSYSVTVS